MKFASIVIILSLHVFIFPQERERQIERPTVIKRDTVSQKTVQPQQSEIQLPFIEAEPDTSLDADTLSTLPDSIEAKSDIDSVVYSSSKDSLIFFVPQKKMNIYGGGHIKYKDTDLKSGQIFIDFETNNIQAEGFTIDSIPGKIEETPVLTDKGEEFKGTRMTYNFKTTRGYITYAQTQESDAAYSGAKIKKVDKDTYFIEKGVFSTCTLEKPHYYFFGHQMKMIQKEQLVGKWIWLAFEDVPFPIPIPFAVFPLQSGRRSGILAPAIGERAGYGRYFSRFGYFWAINDYMDWNVTADYYTKGGYNLNSRFRYVKRYEYNGNIEGSFSDLHQGEKTDPDRSEEKNWRLRVIHNHTLTPTSRMDINLEFMSGDYFKQNSADYSQLLRKEIISNANYYKTWEEAGVSLSANYRRTQNIENGNTNEVLPGLSVTKSQFYPFRDNKSVGEQKWYELIGVNYNGQLQNRRNKIDNELEIRGGIQHSINVNLSPKVGYINITPNIQYSELWYNKRIRKEEVFIPTSNGNPFYTDEFLAVERGLSIIPGTRTPSGRDTVITEDVHDINFVRTFSLGVSASTKIYGIIQPNTLGISAFRHIIQPTISYNFRPDFSKDGWGYFDYYTKSNGERVKYNKFEKEIFGGASSGESQSINFSLSNIFEMKTKSDPTDTTSQEKKIQLLNLNASIGYNFVADSMKFSDINLNYRTQIGEYLNFSGSSSYSLYDYSEEGRDIGRFLSDGGRGFIRLKNFNFSVSTTMSGDKLKSSDRGDGNSGADTTEHAQLQDEGSSYKGLYDSQEPDFSIPWSVSLNYNYNLNKNNPYEPVTYSNISGNLNLNLTKNWKFTVSGSYDLEEKKFSAPQIMISRDLHCWIMNFTWNPLGVYSGYRFELRVKAPQLQDLKITKTDQFFSGRR